MRSIPSLLSFQRPLWPGVVAPDKVLSMGQIELCTYAKLNWLEETVFVYLSEFF